MKKIKYLILFVVVILLLAVALLLSANPLLERAKPQILSRLSETIGAEVNAKKISAQVLPFPRFSLEGLVVDNEKGEDLTLDKLNLEIALFPLFSGKLEIVSVAIEGVQLPVEILKNGEVEVAGINFAALAKDKANSSSGKSETKQVQIEDDKDIEGNKSTPLEIQVTKANLGGVTVSLKDLKSGAMFKVDDMNLELTRPDVNKETNFILSVLAGKDTIKGKGSFSDKVMYQNIPSMLADFEMHLDSLVPYLAFVPDIDPKGLPKAGSLDATINVNNKSDSLLTKVKLKFADQELNLEATLEDLKNKVFNVLVSLPMINLPPLLSIAVPENTPDYKGGLNNLDCSLNSKGADQNLAFKCSSKESKIEDVPITINTLQGEIAQASEKSFELSEGNISLGKGSILIKARTKDTPNGEKSFSSSLKSNNLSIKDLLSLSPPEKRDLSLSGLIDEVNATVNGVTGDKNSTNGTFKAGINDFTIGEYNFLKDLFKALESIPGLDLSEVVPEGYKDVFVGENTRFERLATEGSIKGETIQLSSLLAKAKGYKVEGRGSLSAENINLDIQVIIDQDLVSKLILKKPKIERFKENDGTIVLPLTLRKSGGSRPVITPDIKRLMKQQAGAEIKAKAEKALDKIKPGLGDALGGFLKR